MLFCQYNSVNDFVVLHFDVAMVYVASFLIIRFRYPNVDDLPELSEVVQQLLLGNGCQLFEEYLKVVEGSANVDFLCANCYRFEFIEFGS
jgi:hypothetical protein